MLWVQNLPQASAVQHTSAPAMREAVNARKHLASGDDTFDWNGVKVGMEDGQFVDDPAALTTPYEEMSSPLYRHELQGNRGL